tara:strand:- start:1198 stop:1857 length:660 start_codon:yes stop_codon:yes gene_type:complete
MSTKKLIIALDYPCLDDVINIIKYIDPNRCLVKVGLQLYLSEGTRVLDYLTDKGFEIFLDLKLHDIPNTVGKALKKISSFNVSMTTIHIKGGTNMINAALENAGKTKIIGVTILTSLDSEEISLLHGSNIKDQFYRLIDVARKTEIDGIVCSPHELVDLSGFNKIKVVPGIRNIETSDDQKRTMSAVDAYKFGADFIVVGRPITHAKNIEYAILEYLQK